MNTEEDRRQRLLTVKEVAHILHVPVSWVYTKTEHDELPCVRVGRYVRFDLDAVMASFGDGRRG